MECLPNHPEPHDLVTLLEKQFPMQNVESNPEASLEGNELHRLEVL
jgi:hypothetical protein